MLKFTINSAIQKLALHTKERLEYADAFIDFERSSYMLFFR